VLVTAIKAYARLRLRPKVMIVETTVASLLPIFGALAPAAKSCNPSPLAVVGGMLSSLIHILLVTRVIFAWLHERKLPVTQNKL